MLTLQTLQAVIVHEAALARDLRIIGTGLA